MADLKDSIADSLVLRSAATEDTEAMRKGEIETALAAKSDSDHFHDNDHVPASVNEGNQSIGLTIGAEQIVAAEVIVAADFTAQASEVGYETFFSHPITPGDYLNSGRQRVSNVVVIRETTGDSLIATGVEGVDYSVNYMDGQITILSGSNLETSSGEQVQVTLDCEEILSGPGLQIVASGLEVKFGTGGNTAAKGDHVHANDHELASAGTDTDTVAVTVAADQSITADVVLATDGGLKVNLGSGLAVDVGTGATQVASGDHSHPDVTDDDSGLMTPAQKALVEALSDLTDITTGDTNTVALTKSLGGAITAEVIEGAGLTSDGDGLAVDFDAVSAKSHEHNVVSGISSIAVTGGGSGYTSPPTVLITGDGFSAAATAVLNGEVVESITVNDQGQAYTTVTVTLVGGGGTGATAEGTIWQSAGFMHYDTFSKIGDNANDIVNVQVNVAEIQKKIEPNIIPYLEPYYSGEFTLTVVQGRQYFWEKGTNDDSLDTGSVVLTESGVFTAVNATVTLAGTDELPITAAVYDVTAEQLAIEAQSQVIAKAPLPTDSATISWSFGDTVTEDITIFDIAANYAALAVVYDPSDSKYHCALRAVSGVATSDQSYWAETKADYEAANWALGAYTTGQQVHYTNGKDYQCHTNTDADQVPTDASYWGELIIFAPSTANVNISNSTPSALAIGDTGASGSSSEVSRADHTHPMPGLATEVAPGFISADDYKLIRTISGASSGGALVGFDDAVRALKIIGNSVFVGGSFVTHGSVERLHLAKLSLTGVLDTAFTSDIPLTWPTYHIDAASDGDLIVGVQSTNGSVYKVNPTTGDLDVSFTAINLAAPLKALAATPGGKIALLESGNLRAYDLTGATQFSKSGTTDFSDIRAVTGNEIILSSRAYVSNGPDVGQSYDSTTDPKGLKLIDLADGSIVGDWSTDAGTGAESTIERIAVAPDKSFFVVGNTSTQGSLATTWNGGSDAAGNNANNWRGLYKIGSDGAADVDFACYIVMDGSAGEQGPIPFAIDSDGAIYIGGPIAQIHNGTSLIDVTPNGLYRLTIDGLFDKEFTGFNGDVLSCAVKDNTLVIVGGDFTLYNERSIGRIVFLNPDGVVVEPSSTTSSPGANMGMIITSETAPDVSANPEYKRYLWRAPANNNPWGSGGLSHTPPKLYVYDELLPGWVSLCDICGGNDIVAGSDTQGVEYEGSFLINLNFTNGASAFRKVGGAAVNSGGGSAETTDFWNELKPTLTTIASALNAEDQSEFTPKISVATWNLTAVEYFTHADPMYKAYAYTTSDPRLNFLNPDAPRFHLVARLSNVPDGIYDVHVFAHGKEIGMPGDIECICAEGNFREVTTDGSNWGANLFADGRQYVTFSSIRPIAGNIEIRSHMVPPPEGSGRSYHVAVLNGIQIKKSDRLIGPAFFPETILPPNEKQFSTTLDVSMSALSGADIWYTTDGSTPVASAPSTLYSGPVSISASTTFKAKAFKAGNTDSETVTAYYTKV
jgi:hypothetical protein